MSNEQTRQLARSSAGKGLRSCVNYENQIVVRNIKMHGCERALASQGGTHVGDFNVGGQRRLSPIPRGGMDPAPLDADARDGDASTDTGLFSVNPDVVNSFPEIEPHLHEAAQNLSGAFVRLVEGEAKRK